MHAKSATRELLHLQCFSRSPTLGRATSTRDSPRSACGNGSVGKFIACARLRHQRSTAKRWALLKIAASVQGREGMFHDFQRVVDVMNDGAIERWRSTNQCGVRGCGPQDGGGQGRPLLWAHWDVYGEKERCYDLNDIAYWS